jgi:hypothetical protein
VLVRLTPCVCFHHSINSPVLSTIDRCPARRSSRCRSCWAQTLF